MKNKNLLFVVAIILSTVNLTAQDCSQILRSIYDYRTESTDYEKLLAFLNWQRNYSMNEASSDSHSDYDGGFSYGGMTIDLEGADDKNAYQKFISDAENYSSLNESQRLKVIRTFKTINSQVVKAWENCMLSPGVKTWIVHTKDPNVIVLGAKYVSDGLKLKKAPEIRTISFSSNVDRVDGDFYIGGKQRKNIKLDGSARYQIIKRTSKEAMTVIISATGGNGLTYNFGKIRTDIPPREVNCPKIKVETFSKESEVTNNPKVELRLPPGYKILGGGAEVTTPNKGLTECLLTASYPSSTTSWYAEAKDHGYSHNAKLTVVVFAVYDPNNDWEVKLFPKQSSTTKYPEAAVSVGEGYTMTGGGAIIHWSGDGSLLTSSYPLTDNTWKARGKEHAMSSSSSLTVYAIGLKSRLRCKSTIQTRVFSQTSPKAKYPTAEVTVPDGWTITGGGALVNGDNNLLTASCLAAPGNRWISRSKEHHGIASSVTLTSFAIAIKQ
ncbi:MAG: hypothetical protein AAF927_02390 [Bacteroidota bacterium]